MIGGISRGLTNTAVYNRKGESVQTNAFGYQKCLLDANHSLNEKYNSVEENRVADLENSQSEQYIPSGRQNQSSRELVSQCQEELERELLFRSKNLNECQSASIKQDDSVQQDSVRKEKKNGLSLVGTNVPDTVQEAWDKAEKEAGVNGAALEVDGKLSQITQLFSMSLVRFHNEGNRDVLGSTVDSARAAVRKAIELLGIPQTEAEKKEKLFYEAFLRYL